MGTEAELSAASGEEDSEGKRKKKKKKRRADHSEDEEDEDSALDEYDYGDGFIDDATPTREASDGLAGWCAFVDHPRGGV